MLRFAEFCPEHCAERIGKPLKKLNQRNHSKSENCRIILVATKILLFEKTIINPELQHGSKKQRLVFCYIVSTL
jgi:hypothetical protein